MTPSVVSPRRPPNQRRRWLGRLLAGLVGLLPLVALAGWLCLQYVPAWYRAALADAGLPPPRVAEGGAPAAGRVVFPEDEAQAILADATAWVDEVSGQMVTRRPFAVTLDATDLNRWLAVLPQLWPEVDRGLPPELRTVAIRFEGQQALIGALYDAPHWQAIVHLGVRVDVAAGGETLQLRLGHARGGTLPVPRRVLENLLSAAKDSARWGAADEGTGLAHRWRRSLAQIESAEELFRGVELPNYFLWPNGERPFRIGSLAVRDGVLVMEIVPL